LSPKAIEFGEITTNNGHYAVQGHSRSPILVSIERLYTTSYQWIIPTLSYLASFLSHCALLVKFSLSTGGASL